MSEDVLVQTNEGLISSRRLMVKDNVRWTKDARIIETTWVFEGREVRKDVTVSILRGQVVGGVMRG